MRSNWYYYEHIARVRENLKLIRLKGEIRAINALTIKSLETLDLSVVVPLSREWPGPEIVGNGSSVHPDRSQPHKRTTRIKFRVAMFIDSIQLFLFWHEPPTHASSRYCYFERVVEGFTSGACIRRAEYS